VLKKKKKYIINHLHDSIQCHPNHIEDVYTVIQEVYCSEKFNNLFLNCFIKPVKSFLLEEDYIIFDKLISDFLENGDKFTIIKETFDPKNMYRFE